MKKLSAIIITLNEEKNIKRCLDSIQNLVDEIIVVDSGSTDKTQAICEERGVQFFFKKMEGYGEQKNYALSLTQFEWVLSIDADEEISVLLQNEIKALDFDKDEYSGYYLKRRHVFLGKIFKYGHESCQPILRLFNKQKGSFTNEKVHESVVAKGKTQTLRHHFFHYTTNNVEEVFDKCIKYGRLSAQRLYVKKKQISTLKLILKFPFTFVKEYVFYGNFKNGYEGFIWSFFVALGSVLKYFYLKDMVKQDKQNQKKS